MPAPSLEQLRPAIAAAHGPWDAAWLDPEVFAAHVTERWPDDAALEVGLARLCLSDLYLARACLEGDADAVASLMTHFVRPMRPMLRSMGLGAADIDDAEQELLRLVVLPGARGEPPKLAAYRGQGSLARWCRVTATRLALHTRPMVTPPEGATPLDEGPMRGLERATYARPLADALAAALARLGARERRLLQLSIVERVRNRALGTMFDVHESTVSRWLASAKAALREEVRHCMHASTGVSAAEVDSIIRGYDGHFELSTRLLWPTSSP